jgi:hypothetical protein
MWRARRWDVQFEVGEICSILGGFSRREGAQCAFFINWHAAFARLWLARTVHLAAHLVKLQLHRPRTVRVKPRRPLVTT